MTASLPSQNTGQTSNSLVVWSFVSQTLVSIDIQLSLGLSTANISSVYRSVLYIRELVELGVLGMFGEFLEGE